MFANKGFYDNRTISVNTAIHSPPYNLKSIEEYLDHIKKLTTAHDNDFEGDFDDMTVQEFRDHLKEIFLNNIDDRVI